MVASTTFHPDATYSSPSAWVGNMINVDSWAPVYDPGVLPYQNRGDLYLGFLRDFMDYQKPKHWVESPQLFPFVSDDIDVMVNTIVSPDELHDDGPCPLVDSFRRQVLNGGWVEYNCTTNNRFSPIYSSTNAESIVSKILGETNLTEGSTIVATNKRRYDQNLRTPKDRPVAFSSYNNITFKQRNSDDITSDQVDALPTILKRRKRRNRLLVSCKASKTGKVRASRSPHNTVKRTKKEKNTGTFGVRLKSRKSSSVSSGKQSTTKSLIRYDLESFRRRGFNEDTAIADDNDQEIPEAGGIPDRNRGDSPMSPVRHGLEFWTILLLCGLVFTQVVCVLMIWKVKNRKQRYKAELMRYKSSIVNLKAATCSCIPFVPASDQEQVLGPTELEEKPICRWQKKRSQINIEIPQISQKLPIALAVSEFETSRLLPDDLIGEPQMILAKGDLVQIRGSTKRSDGWAFASKLFPADEDEARNLAKYAAGRCATEAGVFNTEKGWIEESKLATPTNEQFQSLLSSMGDVPVEHYKPPSHWSPVVDASVAELHELREGNPEYEGVIEQFQKTMPTATVVKVERIQNLALWQIYFVKRATMCHRETDRDDNKTDVERRWLWHGSSAELIRKIINQGLNRSLCGVNGTIYGKGVYTAQRASYAAIYARTDSSNIQQMFACRVAVGAYCEGHRDQVIPDERDATSHQLYDSTVNRLSDPSIFVTYHDAQVYPEASRRLVRIKFAAETITHLFSSTTPIQYLIAFCER